MASKHSDESTEITDAEQLLRDEEKDGFDEMFAGRGRSRWNKILPYSIVLNILLFFAVTASWVPALLRPRQTYIPNEVYSPARFAVEYKTVVFTGGLHGDKSAYQGSTPEVDAKWEALYNKVGISQIPAASAAHLPNATTPTAHDPTQYMVELDVFHQLHCLNMLRKLAYPKVYEMDLTSGSEVAEDNIYHAEHCYDQLRQSLQCASDVSTIYWEWSEEKQKMFGNLKTTHTCRDFEKIQAWAGAHTLQEDFDWFKMVKGAPIRKPN